MKRFYWSVLAVTVILAVAANPVNAAPKNNVSAEKTVTASAVIVPAQVSEMGFLISGIVKDMPVQEGDTVTTGQTLMVLDTPDLQFAVSEAEARVRAAQAEVGIRRNEVIKKIMVYYRRYDVVVEKLRLNVPHEVIDKAEAGVQQAQASLEIAQAKLAQGTLTAPFDGTVTSLSVIPGEFVPADQAVVTLANLDKLQVETSDLSEGDISNVHIGDSANIFIEALNKNISGKVIGISPRADTVGGDTIFKVTIAPDEQPEGLLWGMTAEVEILSGE
jgi:RND family efflux transporter MFP subunit